MTWGDENWKAGTPNLYSGWFQGKRGKLLEAGCGIGNMIFTFMSMGFSVWGIEIDPERADRAIRNFPKASIIHGDVRSMPYPDGFFDFVFCAGTVEHFEGTEKALLEIYRVLKPGGHAMVSVPNRWSAFRISKRLQELLKLWKIGYEKSYFYPSFRRKLENAGFDVEKWHFRPCEIGRYPIVAKAIRTIDKFINGSHFIEFWCRKPAYTGLQHIAV